MCAWSFFPVKKASTRNDGSAGRDCSEEQPPTDERDARGEQRGMNAKTRHE